MTANIYMQKNLLTTTTNFSTSFKIIPAILCNRQVKQTKSRMVKLYKQLEILRSSYESNITEIYNVEITVSTL